MKNICFSIVQPLRGCNYCGSYTTGFTRGYSDYSPSGNLDLSKRWKLPDNPTNSEVRIMTMNQKKEVVTICDHLANLKYSPHLPFVFTEHGALMAATILNTERSIQVSLFVIRAFVKLRELVATHKELALKFNELESKVGEHDHAIMQLMRTIRQLMEPSSSRRKLELGFNLLVLL